MKNTSNYYKTVILGAGLCGLSAAYHLKEQGDSDFLLLESKSKVGGLAATEKYDGFSFDYGIHIFYSSDSYVNNLLCNKLLKDNIQSHLRQSYCHTNGVYTEYPYQLNNYGLPYKVIAKNVYGLIAARLKKIRNKGLPGNLEEWIYDTFGAAIADNFMIPYSQRQFAWDLKEMDYDWIADRVLVPDISDVLRGILHPLAKKSGLNQKFLYPVRGGIEALPRAFQSQLHSEQLWTDAKINEIDGRRREIYLHDGRCIKYSTLISTIPLPVLVQLLGMDITSQIRNNAHALKGNIVHVVNVGLDYPELGIEKPMHWINFSEDKVIFHRASFPGNISDNMVPDGCSSVQMEVSESTYRPQCKQTLIERCLSDLIMLGILREKDKKRLRIAEVVTINPAHVIYDLKHIENTRNIISYLTSMNILSKGRFGEWQYLNMDQVILNGKEAAEMTT